MTSHGVRVQLCDRNGRRTYCTERIAQRGGLLCDAKLHYSDWQQDVLLNFAAVVEL